MGLKHNKFVVIWCTFEVKGHQVQTEARQEFRALGATICSLPSALLFNYIINIYRFFLPTVSVLHMLHVYCLADLMEGKIALVSHCFIPISGFIHLEKFKFPWLFHYFPWHVSENSMTFELVCGLQPFWGYSSIFSGYIPMCLSTVTD